VAGHFGRILRCPRGLERGLLRHLECVARGLGRLLGFLGARVARFTASATAVDTLPAVASLFATADFASSAALFPARSASLAAWFAAFQTFWLAVCVGLSWPGAMPSAAQADTQATITSRPSISFDLMESL
jgi:hypothetical protein